MLEKCFAEGFTLQILLMSYFPPYFWYSQSKSPVFDKGILFACMFASIQFIFNQKLSLLWSIIFISAYFKSRPCKSVYQRNRAWSLSSLSLSFCLSSLTFTFLVFIVQDKVLEDRTSLLSFDLRPLFLVNIHLSNLAHLSHTGISI